MNRIAPPPVAPQAGVNATPDAQARDYELGAAYKLPAVHTHDLQPGDAFATLEAAKCSFWLAETARRTHRRNTTIERAEPPWWDAVLFIMFVLGLCYLGFVWDAVS